MAITTLRSDQKTTQALGRGRPGPRYENLGTPLNRMLAEQGTTGTKNFSGVITDEYLPQLGMYEAPRIYDQMRRSDATVAALIAAYIMPIRSAKWYVQPQDDSPDALRMADFMHDNLWNFGEQNFDQFLGEALTFLPFGFSWFEKIFDWMPADEWPDKIGWSKFAFRYQNTRWKWNTPLVTLPGGVQHRKLVSVTQFAPPDYGLKELDVERLLIFSNDREGDNYDGIALLRAAYKHWLIKDVLYRLQGIGLERLALGVPYAKILQHVDADTYAYIKSIIENLRADDQAGIMYDGSEVEIDYLKGKFDAQAIAMAIDHHDGQIMKAGLAQFVNLGTRSYGTTGSYALSQEQSMMFLDALNGKANLFASEFHQQGTIQLMQWNFGSAKRALYPRLAHGDIGQRAIAQLGLALNSFAQYGFIMPDTRTENVIRELLDFPEVDIDERQQRILEQLTGMPEQAVGSPVQQPKPKTQDNQQPQQGNGGSSGGQGSQVTRKKIGSSPKLRSQSLTGTTAQPRAMSESERKAYYAAFDAFGESLSDMRNLAGNWRPERPSEKAARLRRPYEIIGANE